MPSRTRWSIALLGLALLAFAAWWLLHRTDERPATDPVGARQERADTPGEDLHANAPTLKGTAPAGRRPAKPRYTLTVRLPDITPEEAARTRVTWVPLGPGIEIEWREVSADPSGATVIDVAELATHPVATVVIAVSSPDHVTGRGNVEVPKLERRATGFDLSLEIRLTPAAVLVGRVVDETGRPVAEAWVFPDHPGGAEENQRRAPGEGTTTDAEGRFRLRVEPGLDVVGLAWATRRMPAASALVSTRAGTTVDVGTLSLVQWATWEGRVRGAASMPGHLQVWATYLGQTRPSRISGVVWRDDGPLLAAARASVQPDESFTLAPVVPGWWRVQVQSVEERAAVPDVLRGAVRIAHTRDGFLNLDVARAYLAFQVTHAGAPFDDATVVLKGSEPMGLKTHNGGGARIAVRPSTSYEIVAISGGLVSRTITYTSPAAGEEAKLALVLESTEKSVPDDLAWADFEHRTPIRLALEVLGPDGRTAPARLRLTDPDGKVVPTAWVERGMIVSWRVEERLLGRTTAHLLTDLPAGVYTLRIELEGCRPVEQAVQIGGTKDVPTVTVQLLPE